MRAGHRPYVTAASSQCATDRECRGSRRENRSGRRGGSQRPSIRGGSRRSSNNNGRSRPPPPDEKRYACKAQVCYSTRHPADERREAYAMFKASKHVRDSSNIRIRLRSSESGKDISHFRQSAAIADDESDLDDQDGGHDEFTVTTAFFGENSFHQNALITHLADQSYTGWHRLQGTTCLRMDSSICL
ncbi:hypothetical protein ColTof4_13824 [Colletotrichum tofieldiae]|nr:hypothetical protein ColTof3_01725 [Colletotrichum tofieldiae]GKT81401.1 hypothetical protein ColTof4_13824 [Colletotrichum tofieldiae]